MVKFKATGSAVKGLIAVTFRGQCPGPHLAPLADPSHISWLWNPWLRISVQLSAAGHGARRHV